MKTVGYCLFALVYYICSLLPITKKRVLCIMTHDDGEGSNVSLMVKGLQQSSPEYTFAYITKQETMEVKRLSDIRKLLGFFIVKPYQMARSEYILLDNIFLPFAYIHRRTKVKVIQLWHGTGTIKKFGQHVNEGKLKELEKRANRNITHLIVNSEEMKELYATAFGVSIDKVYPKGLPKSDELIQRINKLEVEGDLDKKELYIKYGIPMEKKLILYAPTFRDHELEQPQVLNHLRKIIKDLPEDYYMGLRLHPYIAKNIQFKELGKRICQFTFESDLTTLLMAADILITDYSSIVFDYCLLERPMIFYAYDFDEFSECGRGFYQPYESFVPGPVAYTEEEVIQILNKNEYELSLVRNFKERNYSYLDGDAIQRIIKLMDE